MLTTLPDCLLAIKYMRPPGPPTSGGSLAVWCHAGDHAVVDVDCDPVWTVCGPDTARVRPRDASCETTGSDRARSTGLVHRSLPSSASSPASLPSASPRRMRIRRARHGAQPHRVTAFVGRGSRHGSPASRFRSTSSQSSIITLVPDQNVGISLVERHPRRHRVRHGHFVRHVLRREVVIGVELASMTRQRVTCGASRHQTLVALEGIEMSHRI